MHGTPSARNRRSRTRAWSARGLRPWPLEYRSPALRCRSRSGWRSLVNWTRPSLRHDHSPRRRRRRSSRRGRSFCRYFRRHARFGCWGRGSRSDRLHWCSNGRRSGRCQRWSSRSRSRHFDNWSWRSNDRLCVTRGNRGRRCSHNGALMRGRNCHMRDWRTRNHWACWRLAGDSRCGRRHYNIRLRTGLRNNNAARRRSRSRLGWGGSRGHRRRCNARRRRGNVCG
jgi:hypothetical protein